MIATSIQLGEPVEHRGIVIAPLFPRRTPEAAYVTLEEALPLGFRVEEVSEQGSVPELVVRNPTDKDVLLYDGEELIGAKQNRILNVSVLVAAGAKTRDPGLVRRGGPLAADARRRFASAPHASHPELRRRKVEQLARDAAGARGGAGDRLGRGAARRPPGSRRIRRRERRRTCSSSRAEAARARFEQAFAPAPGQCGAVFALGDTLCLDYVSRPDAFVSLYPKLRAGYLLDAIERLDGKPADTAARRALRRGGALRRNRAAAVRGTRR